MADVPAKREPNFSIQEKKLLLDLVAENPVIENKKTDKYSTNAKDKEWESLAEKFNSSGLGTIRSQKCLRKRWMNMKDRAKSDEARLKSEKRKTGGGPKTFIPDPLTEAVCSVVPGQIHPIDHCLDHDTIDCEEESYVIMHSESPVTSHSSSTPVHFGRKSKRSGSFQFEESVEQPPKKSKFEVLRDEYLAEKVNAMKKQEVRRERELQLKEEESVLTKQALQLKIKYYEMKLKTDGSE